MSKNKKLRTSPQFAEQTNYSHSRYSVSLPEVVNIDVLATMLDEDLSARLYALEGDKNSVLQDSYDAVPWEVEIAYVKREQQIRKLRRENHERYMRSVAQEIAEESDNFVNLPSGDFDNVQFRDLN